MEEKSQHNQLEEQTLDSLTNDQLEKISGGVSQKQFQRHLEQNGNSIIPSNSTINRAHQRRLEQIDNPELAQ